MTEFTIPIKAASLTNQRIHWRKKADVAKKQREAARLHARNTMALYPGHPTLSVHLTRVGRGVLDDDNLRSSMKSIRDGIAAAWKIDDASPIIRWEYAQRCSNKEAAVEVKWEWQRL